MIQVERPSAAKGRLLIRLNHADEAAHDAVKSLLSHQYSAKHSGYLISVEDFPIFDQRLVELGSQDDGDATSDAVDAIAEFQTRRDDLLALKKAPADHALLQAIEGWKTQPYDDQLKCMQFHIARGRSLEGSETGVGKTLTMLYTFLYWRTVGQAKKGVIFCVNSGKLDWEREVGDHTNLRVLAVGNGSRGVLDDLRQFKHGQYDILILHYDAIMTNARSKVDVFSYLKEMNFDFVALDEVHTLKNPEAIRHKRIMTLVDQWKDAKIICATGTAIDGNPKSAWAPLRICADPNAYFPPYALFYRHFVIRAERYFGKRRVMVEEGYKNLAHLKEWMEYASIRYLKSQVLDRPSKIFQTRLVQLTGGQEKLYKEILHSVRQEIQTEEGDSISLTGVAARLQRLRQLINHPKLVKGVTHFAGDSAKYLELDDVIEEILSNPEAQILVWTQWRDAVDMLVQRYRQYPAIAFYGGSDDRGVREAVLSKKARVVVAIPEKAGTSVDWLKVCRTAVYLEKPWNLALYRQSLDRIDRRSNTDAALIINIEAMNSVDLVVNAALKAKQDVFDALTVEDAALVALGKADLLKYLR